MTRTSRHSPDGCTRGGVNGAAGAADPGPLKKALPTKFECRWADTRDHASTARPMRRPGSTRRPSTPSTCRGSATRHGCAGTRTTTRSSSGTASTCTSSPRWRTPTSSPTSPSTTANLWTNDVFELFFRPDADKPGYYEFQVNAAGTVFDAFFPKRRFRRLPEAEEGRGRSTSRRRSSSAARSTSATIPTRGGASRGASRGPTSSAPAAGPCPARSGRFNLCRFDYHKDWKDPELSCVAPIKKKKTRAVLPPDRGLRDAHVRRAGREDRAAIRHRETRAADDEHRGRLPRPAAAVSRGPRASRTTSPTSRSW